MRPNILVTKHVFPETVAFLKQHAEVDYADTQEGPLVRRTDHSAGAGRQAIVSQFTDALNGSVIAGLKGLGMIAHVGVGFDNIDVAAGAGDRERLKGHLG